MWKKNLIVLPSLWFNGMDIETIAIFQDSHLGDTDQKVLHFGQLRHCQKADVSKKLLIDLF